jgi:hypothetical protein
MRGTSTLAGYARSHRGRYDTGLQRGLLRCHLTLCPFKTALGRTDVPL